MPPAPLEEQGIFLDLRNAYAVLEDTQESLKIVSLTVQQATETLETCHGALPGRQSLVGRTDRRPGAARDGEKPRRSRPRYDYEISIAAIERSIGGNRKP